MIKYFISLIVTIVFVFTKAQVTFTSWSQNHLPINSYNGANYTDFLTATLAGNGDINVPNWKISIRLTQPITSANGQYTMPANKVSFQPNSTIGQAYPNPIPGFSAIGSPLSVTLQESGECFLVPQSNAALYNAPISINAYYNLQLRYNVTIMGGAYLGTYPSWTSFLAPVEITAYDGNNNVIGKINHIFDFFVGKLSGTPPITQEMSLQVNMNATNSLLEIKSMQDYNNGTSVTYPSGLKVNSNTNFQIKVRSLNSHLQSNSGNSIPVGSVHIRLQPLTPDNQEISPIRLSVNSQTLAKGNVSQTTNYTYDIKYYTLPEDEQLINAKPEDYSTTLQYEITPQ